ncbi:MAG: S41 family peptidase [Bdellovibrio sp.]|nr:S41 family peptidase [Bdellovibrio sp.]
MKTSFFLLALFFSFYSLADDIGEYENWKDKPSETFIDAETNFKLVMEKLLERYIDKNLTKAELYRAATAGMLASLNSSKGDWNKLLSPQQVKELETDLTGKVTGIGIEMKFDEHLGYGQVLSLIPKSPAEKAGLKMDDQILSVEGKKFKGKQFRDLVCAIRGEVGKSVELKILREDKILIIKIKREIIPWTPVELQKVDNTTALLTIGYFTEETPKLVEKEIAEINRKNISKLIIDLRDNSGGGFDQAVRTAELFLPKEAIIVETRDRSGKTEKYKSSSGLLGKDIKIALVTNKGTSSGAELFAAALRENWNVKVVGETTFGKWNAQTIDRLPNKFAIKYTVKEFLSPQGNSFQGIGMKPDLEIDLPQEKGVREMRLKFDMAERLNVDAQLKAAVELIKSI